MNFLRIFNKALGKFLLAVLIVFGICFYIGVLVGSIYLILMSWVEMPLESEQAALYLELDTKIFLTVMGGLLLFIILGFTYMIIDFEILNPPCHSGGIALPPSLRPKPPEGKKHPTKPILG